MAEKALKAELERINDEPVEVPDDLDAQVLGWLEENPAETWDAAVKAISGNGDGDDGTGKK